MNRFLLVSITLLLLFVGFTFFKNVDYVAFLKIGDYVLESSIFTLVAFLILTTLFLIIFLKTIFFFFDLPFLIKKKWRIKKEQKINESILQSAIYLLIKEKSKAYQLVRKIDVSSIENKLYGELLKIITAKTNPDLEQKITYYKSVMENPEYEFYVLRSLARISYKAGALMQAQEYALKAFNFNKSDGKILEILIYCYANSGLWDKFDETVQSLIKTDQGRLNKLADDIVSFYIKAAKETLAEGDDKSTQDMLERALSIDPVNPLCLELYIAINLNNKKEDKIVNMLEQAFKAKPSLAIAEIYAKFSELGPEQIYQTLSSLAEVNDHLPVFLSIASYLNLPNTSGHYYRMG
jgi:uncharacterized membrane-anchored protein